MSVMYKWLWSAGMRSVADYRRSSELDKIYIYCEVPMKTYDLYAEDLRKYVVRKELWSEIVDRLVKVVGRDLNRDLVSIVNCIETRKGYGGWFVMSIRYLGWDRRYSKHQDEVPMCIVPSPAYYRDCETYFDVCEDMFHVICVEIARRYEKIQLSSVVIRLVCKEILV